MPYGVTTYGAPATQGPSIACQRVLCSLFLFGFEFAFLPTHAYNGPIGEGIIVRPWDAQRTLNENQIALGANGNR